MSTLGKFGERLNKLYQNKVCGISSNSTEELRLLWRVKEAKLLQIFVDPLVEMVIPEGYVPPKLELELCFIACTGMAPETKSIPWLVSFLEGEISRVHNVRARMSS